MPEVQKFGSAAWPRAPLGWRRAWSQETRHSPTSYHAKFGRSRFL